MAKHMSLLIYLQLSAVNLYKLKIYALKKSEITVKKSEIWPGARNSTLLLANSVVAIILSA